MYRHPVSNGVRIAVVALKHHIPSDINMDGNRVTGELDAASSRQLGPPEGGATYAAILAGTVAPHQTSGSLKPKAMDSDPSESSASSESANRRMSNDMCGPLSDKLDGTNPQHAQVTNTCLPAGQRPNKTPIFISGATTPVPSCLGCGLLAQAV
jgi:hypothetical protein